ncbi:MarR family winged helix-turn-helix transcriptional regulator [Clostridium oryzae]|uniref:Putative HTH-type transcriptional regulator YusO n=1 Tax=Clostridium oryzae TaxID=1450648 RepID=A0A1V4IW73_9CLOT|nr:MarR family transcriptional regulator [Clostridium oryzae]OPJ64149.1 putative HTH-type transcriptional regulator YusO [Clostridium oryzae]
MHSSNRSEEAVKLMHEVSKTIKQKIHKNFKGTEITVSQGIIIFSLCKYGEMKISDISERVQLSKSTVSGIIDRMEERGMVERTRNYEDRRTVYVKITKKFMEENKGLSEKAKESLFNLLNSAAPEDIEKIIDALKIMKRILNDKKER